MFFDNKNSSCNVSIANLFADYFASVYVDHNNVDVPFIDNLTSIVPDQFEPSLSDVFNKIESLKSSSPIGPDGLSATFIKNCIFSLSRPIHTLF